MPTTRTTMHRATTTRRRRAEMAIEHVQLDGSTQTTGGTTNLTFGVAPTTGTWSW